VFQTAFPNHHLVPSEFAQKFRNVAVSSFVSLDFRDPVIAVLPWHSISALAVVAVPEAPVDEDDFP
jgi:hypothetical protein